MMAARASDPASLTTAMKLTAELLTHCDSSINALKERELDLRGFKIPAIENMGASRDQNDTIDMTDNDVRFLGNFPRMLRLQHLTLSNNLIARVDASIHKQLPYLVSLILTNNAISDFQEVSHLRRLRHMRYLCLMGNPVAREKHYREFVVWCMPHLRVLDYRRITERERAVARKTFVAPDGQLNQLALSLMGSKEPRTSRGAASLEPDAPLPTRRHQLTDSQRAAIAEAIDRSESMEEIRRLEEQLKLGYIPSSQTAP